MGIKTKIREFYHRHELAIDTIAIFSIFASFCGAYGYLIYKDDKLSKERFERDMHTLEAEHANRMKEIEAIKAAAVEPNETELDKNLKNLLEHGGQIEYDFECADWTPSDGRVISSYETTVNYLPIGNMGVFGEDICKKLDELYPDHKPITDVSMIIDLRSDPTFGQEEESFET